MTIATDFGPWRITYGPSVTLEHTPTRSSIHFASGIDSEAFLEAFQTAQDIAPQKPVAAILAALWADYH